jgi:hypothetical protein
MTANIIQTAKQIVKAKVLEVSTNVEVRVGELIMCLNCSKGDKTKTKSWRCCRLLAAGWGAVRHQRGVI